MFELPGNPKCPVSTFLKYREKLNADCTCFWQKPKPSVVAEDVCWYYNAPLGKNTLGNKMKCISLSAGLSPVYTNHCLRATSVTILDNAGFAARDIMTVSGHHAESSIKNYARTSEEKKKRMSGALASVVAPQSPKTPTPARPRPRPSTTSTTSGTADMVVPLVNVPCDVAPAGQEIDVINQVIQASPTLSINNATTSSQVKHESHSAFHFHGQCVVNIYNK
jgi:hypothetical protein